MVVEKAVLMANYRHIHRMHEYKRAGKLVFMYHDTYGLRSETTYKILFKHLESPEAIEYENECINEALFCYDRKYGTGYGKEQGRPH